MSEQSFPSANVKAVTTALERYGVKNKYLLAGILSTIAKETGFILHPETPYKKTSAKRIREVFGSRVADLTDSEIVELSQDVYAFWEKVYGYKTAVGKILGNTQEGDGAKFVGRGFNGLTGRGNYTYYGKLTALDLVNSPDLLNKVENASEVLAMFYVDQLKKGESSGRLLKSTGINSVAEIDSLQSGVKVAVLITAGLPKNYEKTPILVEGMNKALAYSKSFYKALGGTLGLINIVLLAGAVAYFWLRPKVS